MSEPVIVELRKKSGPPALFVADRPVPGFPEIEARIEESISYQLRVSTIFWGGGRSTCGVGEIILVNTDHALDSLLFDYDYIGGECLIRYGWDTLAFTGIIQNVATRGEGRVALTISDKSHIFERGIAQNLYASGEHVGRIMPVTVGRCYSVPALLTDAANLRFSFHDTTAVVPSTVRDQGVVLTPNTQWESVNVPPHHGFRLLQASAGRITCDVLQGTDGSIAECITQLLQRLQFSSYVASEINGLNSLYSFQGRMGLYIDGAMTYRAAFDLIADSIGGYWYCDREGYFRIRRLELPSTSPDLILDDTDLVGDVEVEFDAAPGLTTTLCALRNWHVHGPSELAGSVRDTAIGALLMKDYRFRTSFTPHPIYQAGQGLTGARRDVPQSTLVRPTLSPSIGGAQRPESDHGQGTLFAMSLSCNQEANRRATLYGGPRYFWRVRSIIGATGVLTLRPGQTVQITVRRSSKGTVFGLVDHRLLLIGIRGEIGSNIAELTLWGPAP